MLGKTKITSSLEDYLKIIYILSLDKGFVRIKDISKELSVANSSVVQAMRILSEIGYVVHERYGYVQLTDSGFKEAEKIFRKHVLIKDFLTNVLNVSNENAKIDACKMEHFLSSETISKIEEYMVRNKF